MKKKIFMITLAACLVVLSIAGTSLAYFTDTDAKSNVFTAGNVDITLTYNTYTAEDARLYPGETYGNPAYITNGDSEEAYVGAIIDVTVPEGTDFDVISEILVDLDANTVKAVETETGFTVYVVVENALAKNAEAYIFTEMTIPALWGNDEMAVLSNLNVVVTAYATQTVGFGSAVEALTTAFGAENPNGTSAWANYPNTLIAE